jgi:hypothetical protein
MAKKVVNFEKMPTAADRELFLAMQEELFEQYSKLSDSLQQVMIEIPQPDPLDSPGLMFAATEWLLMVHPPEPKKPTKKPPKNNPVQQKKCTQKYK